MLAATGLFLHLRLGAELDNTIDQGLHSRAGDVSALVRQAGTGLREAGRSPLIERGENLAQILDGAGRIVDATPAVMRRPLLTPAEVGRAQRATITLDKDRVPGSEDPVRLLGTPVRAKNRRLVVVVATALDDRNDAQRSPTRSGWSRPSAAAPARAQPPGGRRRRLARASRRAQEPAGAGS